LNILEINDKKVEQLLNFIYKFFFYILLRVEAKAGSVATRAAKLPYPEQEPKTKPHKNYAAPQHITSVILV
jgi:hypothetical protein